MKYLFPKSPGFTFIELLVTIAILGVLTAITAVSFRGANRNARDTRRQADLQEVKGGIEEYRLATGNYPANDTSYPSGNFLSSIQPDYVSRNFLDPLNNATYFYEYRYVGASGCNYALWARMENEGNAQACPSACGVTASPIYCLSQ